MTPIARGRKYDGREVRAKRRQQSSPIIVIISQVQRFSTNLWSRRHLARACSMPWKGPRQDRSRMLVLCQLQCSAPPLNTSQCISENTAACMNIFFSYCRSLAGSWDYRTFCPSDRDLQYTHTPAPGCQVHLSAMSRIQPNIFRLGRMDLLPAHSRLFASINPN